MGVPIRNPEVIRNVGPALAIKFPARPESTPRSYRFVRPEFFHRCRRTCLRLPLAAWACAFWATEHCPPDCGADRCYLVTASRAFMERRSGLWK